MDSLVSLRVFAAVAELRSFAAAAAQLDLSPAMVSKHVQHLERRLGARLLNRTSRRVSLSEAGAMYLAQVGAMLDGLAEVEGRIGRSAVTPRGVLKVSLPVWLANPAFAALAAAYRRRYPEVLLDLDFSGRMVNLVEEGFDLALRGTHSPDPGLVARRLADIAFRLVAAPDFLARAGRLRGLDDLHGQPLVAYSLFAADGRARLGPPGTPVIRFTPVLRSANETLLLHAARAGLGFAVLPLMLAQEELAAGRLVQVLPKVVNPVAPLFAVYPNREYLPAKSRTFIDFAAQEFARLVPTSRPAAPPRTAPSSSTPAGR